MKIICPTYKRAGKVKTLDLFGEDLILAVIKSEYDSYKEHYPDAQYMIMPNSKKGNMSVVRNYILKNCDTDHLVMVDDDISTIGYHEDLKQIPLKPEEIVPFLEMGFQLAEDLGTPLWGLNLQSDPKFYREYTPISFLSPILGPFSGIITGNPLLSYDERLGFKEDYDFALQVLYHYHKVLRLNKYYYMADHFDNEGGCNSFRTMKEEKAQNQILLQKWGYDAISYNFESSTNPKINVPIRGV